MKKFTTLFLLLLTVVMAFGQSETHDFKNLDTIITASNGAKWHMLASFPTNFDVPGHPDSKKRPTFIYMPGLMEASGDSATRARNARAYGPHFQYLSGAWDGGLTLANGKHYPFLITVVPPAINPRQPEFYSIIKFIKDRFRLTDIAGMGFSMGGFTWSKSMLYETSAGDETFMKMIKALVLDEGVSNETFAPFNAWAMPGWTAFGHWAKKYGGKLWTIEGNRDTRKCWEPANNMRDSVANSAYFAFTNIGDGGPGTSNHCCFNERMTQSRRNWKCYPRAEMGQNIVWNTQAGLDNRMGTYKDGETVMEWALRQLDTTLVGGDGGGSLPVAIAGNDQTVSLPTNTVTLDGGLSLNAGTYVWTQQSGPSATINTESMASTTVTLTTAGTYVFNLRVSNGINVSNDQITVTVNNPANTPPVVNAGADITINLPTNSVKINATISDNGTITSKQLIKVDGKGTPTIAQTGTNEWTVSGLVDGTYIFRLTATDNDNTSTSDEINVYVVDLTAQVPKRLKAYLYAGAPGTTFDELTWNPLNTDKQPTYSPPNGLKYEDGTRSNIGLTLTNSHQIFDNQSGYGNWQGSQPVWPAEVLRRGSYWDGNRVMTLTGLNPLYAYNLYFLASRDTNINAKTAHTTKFTVNGKDITVKTSDNYTYTATFPTVIPDASGILTITMVGSARSYLNGFIIEEQGAGPEPNQPPLINVPASPITLQAPTSSYTFTTVSVTDPDGTGDMKYKWYVSGGSGTIANDSILNPTIGGLTVGSRTLTLVVTDEDGGQDSKTITITVNAQGNQTPVVNAGSGKELSIASLNESATVRLQASVTDDGVIVERSWRQLSGPTVSLVQYADGGLDISGMSAGIYEFEHFGKDDLGSIGRDTVTVVVKVVTPRSRPQTIVATGEYNTWFIDFVGYLFGLGNLSNVGAGGAGPVGVPKKATGAAATVKFRSASGGLHHGLAIDSSDNVWVVGDNDKGQHGLGHLLNNILVWTKIEKDSLGNAFTDIDTVCAGFNQKTAANYNLAKKKDGTLWIWGDLKGGMAGNGWDSAMYATRPVQIILPGNRKVALIAAGNTIVVYCTDGTGWTWGATSGGYSNLGYKGSGDDYRTPHQINLPTNVIAIAGGGSVNYALTATKSLIGWGRNSNYMGASTGSATGPGNDSIPVPTVLTTLTNALPDPISQIFVNYAATYVILESGKLFGWGDQAQGNLGNGVMLNWKQYGWAWPAQTGMLMARMPQEIAPGIRFRYFFTANTYVYHAFAEDVDGQLYSFGRDKASVLAQQTYIATGDLTARKQNINTQPWIKRAFPFNITQAYPMTAPDCIDGTVTGDVMIAACNTYPIPANTKPTGFVIGGNQSISRNFTTLEVSASDNVFVWYYEWSQVSGPNQAQISLRGDNRTPVKNLINGTYVFKCKFVDNGWLSDSVTVSVTVNQNGNTPPVITPIPAKVIQLQPNTSTAAMSVTVEATDNSAVQSVEWKFKSGTGTYAITNPNSTTAIISNLMAGVYVFTVTVTDDEGLPTSTDVTITVNPAPTGTREKFTQTFIR